MVIWLRRRRRAWAAFITALFTASVLSVGCNECLARERPVDQHTGSPPHHHCMQDEAGSPVTTDNLPDSHCQGVCDCDDLDQGAKEMRSPTADAVDQNRCSGVPVFWLAEVLSPGIIDTNSHRAVDLYAPERARFKPLERFCVLLN